MIYFKKDTALPPFIPLPRFMIASEHSINAKRLYGCCSTAPCFAKIGVGIRGRKCVCHLHDKADGLNRSERTVKTALNDLENAGLITHIRRGWNLSLNNIDALVK